MSDIAIVSAVRTPVGTFMGTLQNTPAHELGGLVITEALDRAKVSREDVTDVIMGQVLTAGKGQNPARQAALAAGLPTSSTAMTINQVCGSGLRAVALGMQSLMTGEADVVVAGGQENMSDTPHVLFGRNGLRMGHTQMTDTMIHDGLHDIFNDYHMGITAENVADHYQITREDMDAFAYGSQEKTAKAIESGAFKKEILPVIIPQRKGEDMVFKTDEHPRLSPLEKLAALKPAFKKDGRVTAGNASGINDGAAAVVLMRLEEAEKRGLKPLAVIRSFATVGVDPAVMGTGPIPASRKALEKAGWNVNDLDLIEANEAFAAQAIAVNKEMGWDVEKVNVNGGAIALGHPIGASGCRVLVTLLHALEARNANKGLVTLCVGGGMGVALTVER